MEETNNERYSLARLRETDMVGYLSKAGYEPVKIRKNGTDFWYLSPLRDEGTASFHVDQRFNCWYDFGLDSGGNLVDFCLRYHGCSIRELLDKFDGDLSVRSLPVFNPDLHEGRLVDESKLLIKEVRPLYAYRLKDYLHERSIPVAIADGFCKEVSYQIGDANFYGIGFKNDSGGYEIRNKNYKQSSAPKDITTISYGAPIVHVFEGFMDFLSWQTLYPHYEPGRVDFVVLNGAGMFDRAVPFLQQHERVNLWLDRDVTGQAYTQYALSMGDRYRDRSLYYEKFKDLNDWLMHKGEVPKMVQKPGIRLSG